MGILFLIMATLGSSTAIVYHVGDSVGWTIYIDYKNWTSNQNFRVAFQYNAQYHNVLQVKREHYNSCNAKSAMATYNTGNDSINFLPAGNYYYISGFPGQCEAGQKVHIRVGSIFGLTANSSLRLGKVPKPRIPFKPPVVVYPYPYRGASTSLSSKFFKTTMLGLAFQVFLFL